MTSTLVKGEDASKVQKKIVSGFQIFDDVPNQYLRAGEDQVALKLINLNAGSELVKGLAFERGTHAAGIEFGPSKPQPDEGVSWVWMVKQMQVEAARKFVADVDTPHAVAVRVKGRRKYADAQLTRQHGDNPAGHTAFGWHTYFVNPFSGVIIHSAGTHYA